MTMTNTPYAPGAQRFEISRVGESTFAILRRQFGASYGLAIGLGAIPVLLGLPMQLSVRVDLPGAGTHPTLAPHFSLFGSLAGVALAIVGLVAVLLLFAALSWGAVETPQDRPPSVRDRLTTAVRVLPVLIGVGLLAYLALAFASVLLIFPALILATMWAVVAPTAAEERTGVFATFRRSAELTKGHRWSIFLLLLVYWIGAIVVTLVAALLVRVVFGVSGSIFAMKALTGPVLYAASLINLLVSGLLNIVGAVGAGVAYHQLRTLKGGFDTRRLSDVFA